MQVASAKETMKHLCCILFRNYASTKLVDYCLQMGSVIIIDNDTRYACYEKRQNK